MEYTIDKMLNFLENGYTNDFGMQWNDTTCDWSGWFGYSSDNYSKYYNSDTLHELLKKMVLSIERPVYKNWTDENEH